MTEFKMAAIIKYELEMNEWNFFYANGGNQSWQVWVSLRGNTKMAESNIAKFKMAEFKISGHHQVEVRMNEFESRLN